MGYNNKYRLERARTIQSIVQQWYEPGRHDRCQRWIWEHKVLPMFKISYSSFKKDLKYIKDYEKRIADKGFTEYEKEFKNILKQKK